VVLESTQHVEHDQVTYMQVGRGRVEAELDAELVAALDALAQVVGDVNLDGARAQELPERVSHRAES
jgi:hypothetical protein